jgi:hypothetical protein
MHLRQADTDALQEFSIEIPDKEADAIHSGMGNHSLQCQIYQLIVLAVNQAVEYILSQPDGMYSRSENMEQY